ncbi:MAG: DUF5069 domain-containing protein [Solirubrobacteraceae bacterium]
MPHAKDLSTEEPRPIDATLAGYPWLPRMIDKARAARANTLGDYYRYPCPIDRACLQALGIDPEQFADIVEQAPSDNDVAEHLIALGIPTPDELDFDPLALLQALHAEPGS